MVNYRLDPRLRGDDTRGENYRGESWYDKQLKNMFVNYRLDPAKGGMTQETGMTEEKAGMRKEKRVILGLGFFYLFCHPRT